MDKRALVVTTIRSPNKALSHLSRGCRENGITFILIGDSKSPPDFKLDGADYYDIQRQLDTGFLYAQKCPTNHYARKNIGYLVAARKNCSIIQETDDDNLPYDSFFYPPRKRKMAFALEDAGWTNVYSFYCEHKIWPRGFSLEHLNGAPPELAASLLRDLTCPVQQGLCDLNPDVDAIYRLTSELPIRFNKDFHIALGKNTWCPFNSQNTRWWQEAFPLMYLPAHCSFRMTDIWRSFVAQKIAWTNGWPILFHPATVYQDRNEHNLLQDFEDEISGYLKNREIVDRLEKLDLKSGTQHLTENLKHCYSVLIDMELVDKKEWLLLDAWEQDLSSMNLC